MDDVKDQSTPMNILLTCYQGARYLEALLLAGGEPVSYQTALPVSFALRDELELEPSRLHREA